MSDFELPTGIGATMRSPFATYVRVGEDDWVCTQHILQEAVDRMNQEGRTITNELMLGYKGQWQVTSHGVEL